MLALQPRFKSFEEYLAYEDDTDQLYELFNGELIAVPTESGLNFEIATFLLLKFAEIVGYRRVRGNGLELEVHGEPKNRFPDLTIIRAEQIDQLAKRNTIRLSMMPPLLVVEVVSPGNYNGSGTMLLSVNNIKAVAFLNIGLSIPKPKRSWF